MRFCRVRANGTLNSPDQIFASKPGVVPTQLRKIIMYRTSKYFSFVYSGVIAAMLTSTAVADTVAQMDNVGTA